MNWFSFTLDVADTFDCNFDGDSEYCGWTRSPTNLIRRNAGSTALANTGPKYDHSLANFIGYYNFLGKFKRQKIPFLLTYFKSYGYL